MKVAVVGGGVMGCTLALALAERGAEAIVLERAVPGAEASSAAAGILGAQAELQERRQHRDEDAARFVRAREAWGAWAGALHAATGIDVGYRVSGTLRVAFAEAEREDLAREVDWQTARGLCASLLDPSAARQIEPQLAEAVIAAAFFPQDGQVDPPMLLRALVAAASRSHRIRVQSGATVRGLLIEHERCVGVALEDGELRADATVLAAGSWSSLIPGVPPSLPAVRPVRGQIVLLDERPPRLRTIVFGASTYVVPRGDGRVLCGSTMENAGFRKEVTAAGLEAILGGVLAYVPSLGAAQFAAAWSNFRPRVDGDAPLEGASPLPGLFLATGHHRNGILLSKVTADAVASEVLAAS